MSLGCLDISRFTDSHTSNIDMNMAWMNFKNFFLFYMAPPCDMEPPTYSSQSSPWSESPKVFRQFQSCPIWENGPPFARWQHIWCPCLLLYLPPGHNHQCWPGADWCTALSCSKSLRREWSCLSAKQAQRIKSLKALRQWLALIYETPSKHQTSEGTLDD